MIELALHDVPLSAHVAAPLPIVCSGSGGDQDRRSAAQQRIGAGPEAPPGARAPFEPADAFSPIADAVWSQGIPRPTALDAAIRRILDATTLLRAKRGRLRVKLRRLSAWNEERRAIAARYDEALAGVAEVRPLEKPPYDHVHAARSPGPMVIPPTGERAACPPVRRSAPFVALASVLTLCRPALAEDPESVAQRLFREGRQAIERGGRPFPPMF